jgi:hypothetical protein
MFPSLPLKRALISFLLVFTGCAGGGPSDTSGVLPPTDTAITATHTNPNYQDTGFPPGDEGSLMVVEAGGHKGLYAMFVNQQPGFENLAYCAVTHTVCIPGFATTPLPYDDVDKADPFDPTVRFASEFSQYRYVGDEITFAGYTAPLYYDSTHGFAYYYLDLTGQEEILGPVGVSWGAQWGPYLGTNDITLHEPIELLTPREGAQFNVTNATTFPVEWTPQEDGGTIHLFAFVGDPLFTGVQFTLQDDGYFDVPIDTVMGLAVNPNNIQFSLERWNTDSVTFHGNTLDIAQVSQATFAAHFDYVGSRTELVPADNCAEAVNETAISSVGTYSYWSRLKGYQVDVPNACNLLNGNNPTGLVRVDMPPLTRLEATEQIPDPSKGDAAVWITDNCMGNACLAGADINAIPLPESVAYFNTSTTETKTVYVVLSGAGITDGIVTLDIVLDQLLDPQMKDECLAATQEPAIGDGAYYSSETSFLNSLDPGIVCTGDQTPGPDAMTHVLVPAGETITVLAQMDPPGDPALYIMTQCTNPQFCVAGADRSLGQGESVQWTNTAGSPANIYLVVDTKGAPLQPYFLTITFSP